MKHYIVIYKGTTIDHIEARTLASAETKVRRKYGNDPKLVVVASDSTPEQFAAARQKSM